ncbi:elongation factor P 5-aminopentanone reductase [Clostridium gasigenes]|uniref:3-oxoacyl-[acyl-carrier protein] reductase n=1 Tax=Clostridium gasigenes TaxID=94869 RepID=A0A1H0UF79_9CLOT|nr:SDR family oxidoreductase [Clostridium gasigenes]MBU3089751.1 SDR family oxidoreductase [Clostridium gasigenes]MBU3131403.1 SDR family oxidoreductase [Clostridium gasigenes]MBU3134905.1 SDR family oxidoreductase [Clostridium gasigenes]NKF08386.1 SDR family oxidoreductase [Clostridium gasigenes]QSW18650.1 SDR family oxidoreductase [Clostridium gasigenes]
MGSLRGKVALVTGASRGIGKAIALELSRDGASVIINYSKDDNGAELTLVEIIANGGSAKLLKGDISSFEKSKIIIDEAIKMFGKIDILVNNAGISQIGLFMDSSEEDIDAIIGTNLLGAMYLSKHVLPHMISKGCGNIVNISSMWGEVGASCEVLYSASKGGLNLFTKALAKEVALSGVRVNAIAPGVIETEMNSFLGEEERKALEEEIPMGRFGDAKEIGKAVSFLCDDNCKYLTGQIIRIDGGMI